MNKNTLRALLADARYQVFDNVVFRILFGIAALLVLLSFIVSFQQDQVSVLFGVWEFGYGEIALFSSGDPRTATISGLQSLLVEVLAGTFGILLAIAATAFFTPKMLEKGAADNLFSEPIGRFTLLLSRYFAGVLFVALLSLLMVFGIQAGLAVSSGYHDWGFLWSALTLVYVYASLQAFSVLVATVMRNSVAAILLTMLLFLFTGCTNQVWTVMEFSAATSTEQDDELADGADERSAVGEFMYRTMTAFRSVLPRTGDADVLARKLRRQLEGAPTEITIYDGIEDVFFLREPHPALEFRGGGAAAIDGDGLVWDVAGGGTLTMVRTERETRVMGSGRERRVTAREYAREALEEVEARLGEDAVLRPAGVKRSDRVDWREPDGTANPRRARAFVTQGDHVFVLSIETTDEGLTAVPDPVDEDDQVGFEGDIFIDSNVTPTTRERDVLEWILAEGGYGYDPDARSPDAWYARRFTMDSPWHYNVFVSIGTTLVFSLVMLLLAGWRLSRIDF